MSIEKGDKPGHPFRGNQWTSGSGGGEAEGATIRNLHQRHLMQALELSDDAEASVLLGLHSYNSSPGHIRDAKISTKAARNRTRKVVDEVIASGAAKRSTARKAFDAHISAHANNLIAGNRILAAKHERAATALLRWADVNSKK